MEMTGEYRIEAPREAVWAALNDPEVLQACIPGCESLERSGEAGFAAKVRAKVGPVSTRFAGSVTLSDVVPPERYTISGEGKGGAAGFAKGGAKVRLDPVDGGTLLHYQVEAKVGGKLAQLGGRLIDSTAKKMADDFFGAFAARVGTGEAGAPEPTPAEEAEMAAKAMKGAALGHTPPQSASIAAEGDEQKAQIEAGAAEAATHAVEAARARRGLSPIAWVALLVAVVAILLALFA